MSQKHKARTWTWTSNWYIWSSQCPGLKMTNTWTSRMHTRTSKLSYGWRRTEPRTGTSLKEADVPHWHPTWGSKWNWKVLEASKQGRLGTRKSSDMWKLHKVKLSCTELHWVVFIWKIIEPRFCASWCWQYVIPVKVQSDQPPAIPNHTHLTWHQGDVMLLFVQFPITYLHSPSKSWFDIQLYCYSFPT